MNIEEKEFIIYKITNIINGKIYIGQTREALSKRKWQHLKDARSCKYNFPIYRAMRKHGLENFKFEVVDKCVGLVAANILEIDWIKRESATDKLIGYNVLKGGDNRDFTPEMLSVIHKSMFLAEPRDKKYKGVLDNKSSFYSQFMFNGNRTTDGPFRTEIEAAWSADLITRSNIGPGYDFYKNFPNGKTKKLILEQMITVKMESDIIFAVNNPHIARKDKYQTYVTNIKTKEKIALKYGTIDQCNCAINEFINEHKAIKMFKGIFSLQNLQVAYEKLHGSIYNLISEEELEEACKTQLGSFE